MEPLIPVANTLDMMPGVRPDEIVLIWQTTSGQLVSAVTTITEISGEEI